MHPTMVLLGVGGVLRRSILPLLVGGYAAVMGNLFILFLVIFPAVISTLALLGRFLSFRYALGEGHIRIREGIFSRKIRSIPVKRIHNLNTRQSPVARLFRVSRLDIETAGGGAAEASFVALSYQAVQEIRDFVRLEKRQDAGDAGDEDVGAPAERTLYRIGIRDILIAGATTNRMGVIFVALAALFQYAQDAYQDFLPPWIEDLARQASTLENQDPLTLVLGGLAAFAALFLVAWLISIAAALLRWHRFTLSRGGEDLHIRAGLLTIREFTIPRGKVQALTCVMSAFRRPFGLLQIKVRSAGHVGVQDGGRGESDVLAPIARLNRTDFFVSVVWPAANWDDVAWRPVHVYTRTRQFRFLVAWLVVVSTALLAIFGLEWNQTALPIVWIVGAPLAWLISHLTYRQTGYACDERFIYIKRGFLGMHYWVIPINRIQNASVLQSPFQRWRRLGSLALDVAGPSGGKEAVIPNIDATVCWLLFNRFIHPAPDPGGEPRRGAGVIPGSESLS